MGTPSNVDVRFHRAAENHLAARIDNCSMIAIPLQSGGLSIWSAYAIDKEPEKWTRDDFFIVGETVDGEGGFRAHVLEIAEHKREVRRLLRPEIRSGSHTPWGAAQASYRYGEGIVCHSTAGHGGFHLDECANARVHQAWRSPTAFYEEDVEWSIVAVTYPNLFTTYERKCADETLRHFRRTPTRRSMPSPSCRGNPREGRTSVPDRSRRKLNRNLRDHILSRTWFRGMRRHTRRRPSLAPRTTVPRPIG